LIVLHATAALVCFAAGVLCLCAAPETSGRIRLYFWSLLAMLAFVVAAIAVDWRDLDTAVRVTFVGLVGLGLYVAWRAIQARARLRRRSRLTNLVGAAGRLQQTRPDPRQMRSLGGRSARPTSVDSLVRIEARMCI
jgi:hypothetical protein